jgi:hypothetical protein
MPVAKIKAFKKVSKKGVTHVPTKVSDYTTDDFEYLRSKQGDDEYWDERIRRRDQEWQQQNYPERVANNPNAEPCGHFTGRCSKCGSSNLWDDNLHYGCNSCGAFLA